MVEMLRVGEETAATEMLAKVSGGYSTSCMMEGDTTPRNMEGVVSTSS